jgi:hypothetical protein
VPDSVPATAPSELRVAFVGQSVFFAQCSLELPCDGVEPTFVDFRSAAPPEPLIAKLRQIDPDVVLVFRPEIVPAGLFDSLRAYTIGYLTEPLPRTAKDEHPDLRTRLRWLQEVDSGNFDRIVCFDPLIAPTAASVLPVWRSKPIPVSDRLFSDVRERGRPPRLLFVGRSTEHREQLLVPVKRDHRIVHAAHGLFGDRLARFMDRADVQLNLHNNPYPSFENRVCIALAAGHLVISEQLSPRHDLEPGRDYLEFDGAEQLAELVQQLERDPDAYLDIQRSGREKAESFRASRVYPQLLREAIEDVAASGSPRRRALTAPASS